MSAEKEAKDRLEWKDHLAMVIALLETVYLPILILIIILFILAIFL